MCRLRQVLGLVLLLVGTLMFLCGCGGAGPKQVATQAPKAATEDGLVYKTMAEADGKTMGVLTGSTFDKFTEKILPHSPLLYYNSYTDAIFALKSGKIEGFLADEPVARSLVVSNTGVGFIKKKVADDAYGIGVSKNRPELKTILDQGISRFKQDGTLKKIDDIWFGRDESLKKMPPVKNGTKGTVRVAGAPDVPPMLYIKDGAMVGYEADIVLRILQEAGYTANFVNIDFGGLIPALSSGKADIMMGAISITDERKQSVLFAQPHYEGGIVFMEKDTNNVGVEKSFWEEMKSSFNRNFIVENRYKLIEQGLENTVIISLGSAILGTILGFGLCLLRRSSKRFLNLPARIFIKVMQGTPMVVFLMIMYYVVFGSTNLSPIFVAIIAFAFNEAAYMGEMMRTGIDGIDKGQTEAAYAMGFSKVQTFGKIVMPQALRNILPLYTGEFVSLVKMTSVVGYIAIQDLTKMSDIIRSRTYEAFFPLIMTALIYFLVAWVLTSGLSYLEYKIDPKKRPRTVTGVKILV